MKINNLVVFFVFCLKTILIMLIVSHLTINLPMNHVFFYDFLKFISNFKFNINDSQINIVKLLSFIGLFIVSFYDTISMCGSLADGGGSCIKFHSKNRYDYQNKLFKSIAKICLKESTVLGMVLYLIFSYKFNTTLVFYNDLIILFILFTAWLILVYTTLLFSKNSIIIVISIVSIIIFFSIIIHNMSYIYIVAILFLTIYITPIGEYFKGER